MKLKEKRLKMKKWTFIALFLFCTIPCCFAQLKSYSFEEAEKLAIDNPKPFVVFVQTSWCKYCKIMENTTLKNPKIITILNTNFYFISFDAEEKATITFNNHIFKFKPNGRNTGIHELATALATINSQVVYPTVTILLSDYSIIYQKHSFQNDEELLNILQKTK